MIDSGSAGQINEEDDESFDFGKFKDTKEPSFRYPLRRSSAVDPDVSRKRVLLSQPISGKNDNLNKPRTRAAGRL